MLKNKNKILVWGLIGILMLLVIILATINIQTNKQKQELEGKLVATKEGIKFTTESLNKLYIELEKTKKEANKLKEINKELNKEITEKKKEVDKKDEEIKKLKQTATKISNQNVDNSSKNKIFNMNATHYSAFCPTGCTGVTATGIDVSNTIYHKGKRIVAVDPKVIPLGSIVRVTGSGYDFEAIAADTGGDIKGSGRIDILVESTAKAYELGRKNVKVEIIN